MSAFGSKRTSWLDPVQFTTPLSHRKSIDRKASELDLREEKDHVP
jgi:hypothetical protein